MKATTDLFFAAFLVYKGNPVANYEAIGQKKLKYSFNIDDEAFKQLRLEFLASQVSKIKQIIEELKDLAY